MSDIILKAENISKQYRLGLVGSGTIAHDLNRWWYKVRGKDDPYLKIGEANDRSTESKSGYVWALKDINFEVKRGEVLGIIGKNGAGKSTLLKLLSRVTSPTTGTIKTRGRIASLLEVGTGFHPELTGLENIYLNGAILGMTKAEIKSKEAEIIEFSGCQRYIDTPVKRYSSGMRVRLAFAVAAFLEPDILVIDEVLAVGDAEFQKKAIGKMQNISKGEGRTVLFVSHNMAAVKSLCTRAIVLEHGENVFESNASEAVDFYLERSKDISQFKSKRFPIINSEYGITVLDIKILEKKNEVLFIQMGIKSDESLKNIGFGYKVIDNEDNIIGSYTPAVSGEVFNLNSGVSNILIEVHDFIGVVCGGQYYFDIFISKPKVELIIYAEKAVAYLEKPLDRFNTGVVYERNKHGIVNLNGVISVRE